MDVTHPGSQPLNEDQKALLESFRSKVETRISSHGLTAADVQVFVDEIKKYERKKLDVKLFKPADGKQKGSIDLSLLIKQVTGLKGKMSKYRPMLSDDIMIAFESLL